jgi:ribosome-binding factor A
MPNPIRMKRISERIREELSLLLVRNVADPRLEGVMITDVMVDRELAYAEIYVSSVNGQEKSQEILRTLRHAGGFMRTALAQRIELRSFPRLRFHWDPTPERADHIERLLNELLTQSSTNEPAAELADTEEEDELDD